MLIKANRTFPFPFPSPSPHIQSPPLHILSEQGASKVYTVCTSIENFLKVSWEVLRRDAVMVISLLDNYCPMRCCKIAVLTHWCAVTQQGLGGLLLVELRKSSGLLTQACGGQVSIWQHTVKLKCLVICMSPATAQPSYPPQVWVHSSKSWYSCCYAACFFLLLSFLLHQMCTCLGVGKQHPTSIMGHSHANLWLFCPKSPT